MNIVNIQDRSREQGDRQSRGERYESLAPTHENLYSLFGCCISYSTAGCFQESFSRLLKWELCDPMLRQETGSRHISHQSSPCTTVARKRESELCSVFVNERAAFVRAGNFRCSHTCCDLQHSNTACTAPILSTSGPSIADIQNTSLVPSPASAFGESCLGTLKPLCNHGRHKTCRAVERRQHKKL